MLKRLILAFFFICSAANASSVVIRAKEISGNFRSKLTALGNVSIVYGSLKIKADRASYFAKNSTLLVQGNVTIKQKDTLIHCEKAVYNTKERTLELWNLKGRISKRDRIEAAFAFKKGDVWLVRSASYTPCCQNPPDWSIGAYKLKVLDSKSFSALLASFKLKGLPVFVLPYISAPILKKRTSGLLLPRLSYRRQEGFIYRQPIYFVLGRSADLTLTLEKYLKSGYGASAELRYVFGKNDFGNLLYHSIYSSDSSLWSLKFKHKYFPSDWQYGSADIDIVSSRQFYSVAGNFTPEYLTQQYTRSELNLSKLWEHSIFNVRAVFLKNLDGSTKNLYQKLPEIQLYIMDRKLGRTPLLFSFDSVFTYLYREAGGSAARALLTPSVRLTRQFGPMKSSLKTSYRLALYTPDTARGILKVNQKNSLYISTSSFSLNPYFEFEYVEKANTQNVPIYDRFDYITPKKGVEIGSDVFGYFANMSERLRISGFYNTLYGGKLKSADLNAQIFSNGGSLSFHLAKKDYGKKELDVFLEKNIPSFGLRFYLNFFRALEDNSTTYLRAGGSLKLNRYLSLSASGRYDVKLSFLREMDYRLSVNRGCWQGALSYRWIRQFNGVVNYEIMLTVNLLRIGGYSYRYEGQKLESGG